MSIPWILLLWRDIEREAAEAARSRIYAAGLPHCKDAGSVWSRALQKLDQAVKKLTASR